MNWSSKTPSSTANIRLPAAFANMLNEMRLGMISEQTVANFKSLERELRFDDGLEVTEL